MKVSIDPETGRPGWWEYFDHPAVFILPALVIVLLLVCVVLALAWVWDNLPFTLAALIGLWR